MEEATRAAVARFRTAREQGGLSHVTFEEVRRSCGDACELLGECLRECGLGDWMYQSDWSLSPRGERMSSHAWLERDGLIVDITTDQFDTGQPAVLLTRDRSWHTEFEPLGGARRAGLDYYEPGPWGTPFRADYRNLKQRVDALIDS